MEPLGWTPPQKAQLTGPPRNEPRNMSGLNEGGEVGTGAVPGPLGAGDWKGCLLGVRLQRGQTCTQTLIL